MGPAVGGNAIPVGATVALVTLLSPPRVVGAAEVPLPLIGEAVGASELVSFTNGVGVSVPVSFPAGVGASEVVALP